VERGMNAFADESNAYGLSETARAFMAGVLAHARGMSAILAPTVNSYKRLTPGYEAPTYLTWGRTNRSALIRVPMVSPGKSIEGTRAEVRCPDPSSNTYLAFAVMIAAGLDGVERGLQLGDPVEESLFEMDAATIASKGIKELPGTLGEAIVELEADSVVCEALGDHVLNHFVEAKRAEWDDYRTQVSDWEVERYLDQF
jgi:glutamine synthetase